MKNFKGAKEGVGSSVWTSHFLVHKIFAIFLLRQSTDLSTGATVRWLVTEN